MGGAMAHVPEVDGDGHCSSVSQPEPLRVGRASPSQHSLDSLMPEQSRRARELERASAAARATQRRPVRLTGDAVTLLRRLEADSKAKTMLTGQKRHRQSKLSFAKVTERSTKRPVTTGTLDLSNDDDDDDDDGMPLDQYIYGPASQPANVIFPCTL